MYKSNYRGKKRVGLTPGLFFYIGLIMLVLAAAIYLFAPSIKFIALLAAASGAVAVVYAGLRYASENSRFALAAAVALNIIRAALLILLVSFVVVEALIIVDGDTDADAGGADYIIVMGAGVNGTEPSLTLWSRLNAAVAYLRDNPDTVAVLSGGQGAGEDITEAECMRRYLEARNIAPERMILEPSSTNSIENIRNSLSLIYADIENADTDDESRALTADSAKIAVLSNEFHLYRSVTIGRNEGVTLYAVNAPMPRVDLKIAYHVREYFSMMKVFLTYLFI